MQQEDSLLWTITGEEVASPRVLDWNRIESWLRHMPELHDSIMGVDEVVATGAKSRFFLKA